MSKQQAKQSNIKDVILAERKVFVDGQEIEVKLTAKIDHKNEVLINKVRRIFMM